MKFKQTLLPLIALLVLMLTWDTACFAQTESEVVLNEDSLYLFDEEVESEEENEFKETNSVQPGTSANAEYLKEKLKERDFNEGSWNKAVDGLDYSKDRPEPPEKEPIKETRDNTRGVSSGTGTGFGTGMQVLLFGVVIIALALLLFFLVGGKYTKNTKIKNEKAFTVEDIEERIHESDLDKFLREALSKSDFRLAVRIYYLAIIKELSIKEFIRWKKDKTNREYLNEVIARKPDIYNDFRDTTLAFEKVWYGDIKITEGDYMNISPRFKQFIESLNKLS